VEEHIRIFSDLKCLAVANEEVIADLVRRCDLEGKLTARAKTLSGGQKRKLQLAIMFAGGSAVCCVDEVSTGLDPISRRRIWEILLAERSNRTILMTTHFLDEADFLADNIAILYKGSLKAEGTSVALKNTFGNGYTVKIANSVDLEIILSGPVEKETSRHQTVYRVATAALVAELVDFLEHHNIEDYQVSGPTMEELFLKATGDAMNTDEHSPAEEVVDVPGQVKIPSALDGGHSYYLVDGQPLNAFYQWWILFCKRLRILKRRFIPYGVILALSLVGAGVSPKLIKGYTERIGCPSSADTFDYYTYRLDFGSNGFYSKYLLGPMDQVDSARLEEFANIYSPKYDEYQDPYSPKQRNLTTLRKALVPLNSTEEMAQYLKAQQNYVDSPYYGDREFVYGGVWLGDSPTISFLAEDALFGLQVQNMMNILLSGVPISAAYSNFSWKNFPLLYDFRALEFIIYFGLIMACYPAFFALYPTNERISNVRPMQYSNGIRPLPLWLSHLAFDAIFVVIISAVGVALLSVATTAWLGIGYIFLVMLFYGIVATLQSYIISMFAKSAIAAWFFCTVMQIILYFAYFGALLGIQSNVEYKELEHYNNAVSFGIGIISPIVNLEKAFFIGLGQMGFLCNGRSASSVYLYGGPILYLVLQGFLLFAILLWWDTSFVLPSFRKNKQLSDSEAQEMDSADMIAEVKRINSKSTDLRVENLSKRFGKNLAVDNVTFGVQNSEIFALLGPNGAGKSTIISMIRGDIKPSTPTSSIHIAGHSILSSPIIARAHLGVCPQFDSADVLTVKETLRFFAKTRGVGDVDHNVATVIAACGLEPWTNQLAQKLSGGTKRKLSLAVALVGNPRVLVLDEPSSALDANAKRNMWRTLQSIGKNRSIVLTTHSMEEADALADRIGIVSSRMLAIGDREALKKRAGDAFHIHLVAKSAPRTTPQELHVMKDWIAAKFAGARISRETQGGQIRFEVPAEGQNLVGLIKMLEHAKEELGVEFFSVGKATLDEVFENIVKKYGNNGDYAMDEK
jgi:ATP-binding cassette subfamily A (ABC1) protein 3